VKRPPGWELPPLWSVPRLWPGERIFILCGGESVRAQRTLIPRLRGRFIAIKEGVLLRPDADVLFLGGERSPQIALPLIPRFRGTHMVIRGRSDPSLPPEVHRITRTKDHEHLCEIPTHVCGYDSGTSAINLAWHLCGPTEVILIGYDMTGGRWFTGEWPHPMPVIPRAHHLRHASPLAALAEDCTRKGLTVINVSPISRAPGFARRRLEEFL
jgi:hypothetical protein